MQHTKAKRAGEKTRTHHATSSASRPNAQLDRFFNELLKDIYWAEKHLIKALPKMHKAATTEQLQQAIDEHTAQTEEHVVRLERVFELLDKRPQAKKCEAMEGLIKEGETVIEETEDGSMTRDAAIIISAQKIEHYEIAAYGGMVQLAKTMGHDDVAEILHATLEEEKEADSKLTGIAENNINCEAEQEDEEE